MPEHYANGPVPYADQLENDPAQQGYQHVDAGPDQNSIHGSSQGMSDPYAGAYSDAPPTAVRPAVPPDWHGHDHVPNGSYGQRAQKKAGSRKSLYLTGSAIGVLVVGIGAALALWDNGTPAGKIPTITASGDTMKIKADGVSEKTVRTVSILQPGKSAPAAKVVSSGEQPIDLAQVPDEPKKARRIKEEELSKKLNLADRNLTRPIARSAPDIKARTNSGGYFPEPRKVRTVMVRPDGSLIDPTASIQPKPVAAPVVRMPRQAAPARVEQDSRTRSVATPASRKAAPRVRTISRAAARPVPPAANRTAALDLTPKRISRTPASGGGFAVQLAAPASESAARSVASKAKARFGSVFAGRSPSIQQAVVKSRTVYRVRVGGLSRGDASKMCSQVKAKGGNCYVARN